MGKLKLTGESLNALTDRTGAPEALLETLSSREEIVIEEKKKRGRPATGKAIGTEKSEYIRATAVVNKTQWAKLQTIAKMEGVSLKGLLEAIYSLSIANYEEKKGEVRVSEGEDLSSILSK